MQCFKDSLGREWLVRISGPVINDVRKELDVDLVSLSDPVFPKLTDLALLVNCLWVICRKQANAVNITPDNFGESLVGDCLDGAARTLVDAVLDFFPQSIREMLRPAIRQDTATKDAAIEMFAKTIGNPEVAAAMLEKQKADLKKMLDRLMPQTSATDLPDLSHANQTTAP